MHKKVLALVLAAILLSGCDMGGVSSESRESADNTNSSDISSESSSSLPQSTATNSETGSEPQPESPETVTNNSSKVSAPVKTGMPEEISDYIDSLDNGDFVFVDYTFDENPDIITDVSLLGDIYDKALAALKNTDDYRSFFENYANAEFFGRFTEKTENFLNENSEPVPIFKRAITDDLDNDGIAESFVMIAMPKIPYDNNEERWFEREYLLYVGENGAVLLDDYYNADIQAVTDYGCCKQIVVSSEGWSGNDSKSIIWGVQNGDAVKLYGGRLRFSKTDCFLYSEGQQYIGDFAVYDINKGEYLAIRGKELSAEDIRAMDTDNAIQAYNDNILRAVLIGGKYFVVNRNGVYTYENGRFERSDKQVRSSATPGYTGDPLNTLDDVDYDAAVASMITPEGAEKLI